MWFFLSHYGPARPASLPSKLVDSDQPGLGCSRYDRRHRGIQLREFRRSAPAQHTGEPKLPQNGLRRFAFGECNGDNFGMARSGDSSQNDKPQKEPFSSGALVIATLSNPREK